MIDISPSLSRVYWFGIDPGVSGGLAVIGGSGFVDTTPLSIKEVPLSNKDILSWFGQYYQDSLTDSIKYYGTIELVTGWIDPRYAKGRKNKDNPENDHAHGGQPGSAMFTFGKSAGRLEMALDALDIEYGSPVHSRTWQKTLGFKKESGMSKTVWKGYLKEKAQELFPKIKVTLKVADALLLAHYCKKMHGG